jgi:hypothetical protein
VKVGKQSIPAERHMLQGSLLRRPVRRVRPAEAHDQGGDVWSCMCAPGKSNLSKLRISMGAFSFVLPQAKHTKQNSPALQA